MEENQQTQPQPVQTPSEVPQSPVRHRGESSGKGKKVAVILIILALLLIVGSVLFYLGSKGTSKVEEPTSSPESIIVEETPVEEEATPTPEPVDKSDVGVQILNGTGIVGEASYLQGVMKELGFEKIEVGNAPSQNETKTTLTFSDDLAQSLVDEVTTELKKLYADVSVKTDSSASIDIKIVTGLRKGQTAKPSASATSTSSPTTTSSPTATPTPTPTATPS